MHFTSYSTQVQVGISKHLLFKSKFFKKIVQIGTQSDFVFAGVSRLTFSIILGPKIVSKLVKIHPRTGFHTATFAKTAQNTAQILRVTCLSIQKWSPSSPNDSQEGPLWLHFVAHTVHVMAMKLSMTTHDSQITIESTRSISRQAHKHTNTQTHTHTHTHTHCSLRAHIFRHQQPCTVFTS